MRLRHVPGESPTPAQVRAERLLNKHTQAKAARMVECTERTWQKYEAGEKTMLPVRWKLYLLLSRLERYRA